MGTVTWNRTVTQVIWGVTWGQTESFPRQRGATTQTRTFAYYGPGLRFSSATNPENGTVTYSYNGWGRVVTVQYGGTSCPGGQFTRCTVTQRRA